MALESIYNSVSDGRSGKSSSDSILFVPKYNFFSFGRFDIPARVVISFSYRLRVSRLGIFSNPAQWVSLFLFIERNFKLLFYLISDTAISFSSNTSLTTFCKAI